MENKIAIESYRSEVERINAAQHGRAVKPASVVVERRLNLPDLMLFRINQAALLREIDTVNDNIAGSA